METHFTVSSSESTVPHLPWALEAASSNNNNSSSSSSSSNNNNNNNNNNNSSLPAYRWLEQQRTSSAAVSASAVAATASAGVAAAVAAAVPASCSQVLRHLSASTTAIRPSASAASLGLPFPFRLAPYPNASNQVTFDSYTTCSSISH